MKIKYPICKTLIHNYMNVLMNFSTTLMYIPYISVTKHTPMNWNPFIPGTIILSGPLLPILDIEPMIMTLLVMTGWRLILKTSIITAFNIIMVLEYCIRINPKFPLQIKQIRPSDCIIQLITLRDPLKANHTNDGFDMATPFLN